MMVLRVQGLGLRDTPGNMLASLWQKGFRIWSLGFKIHVAGGLGLGCIQRPDARVGIC